MKKLLKLALGCIFALMMVSQAWAAGASAYSSSTVGPNVYTKGFYNFATFNPIGSFPPGSYINGNLYYNYSMSYRPTGLVVLLCWDTTLGNCVNVTSAQSGSTTIFQGQNPNHSFVIAVGVAGSGTLSPPIYGNMDQIIVNFSYP